MHNNQPSTPNMFWHVDICTPYNQRFYHRGIQTFVLQTGMNQCIHTLSTPMYYGDVTQQNARVSGLC